MVSDWSSSLRPRSSWAALSFLRRAPASSHSVPPRRALALRLSSSWWLWSTAGPGELSIEAVGKYEVRVSLRLGTYTSHRRVRGRGHPREGDAPMRSVRSRKATENAHHQASPQYEVRQKITTKGPDHGNPGPDNTQIYEGTNQIQRMAMARQLLKGW